MASPTVKPEASEEGVANQFFQMMPSPEEHHEKPLYEVLEKLETAMRFMAESPAPDPLPAVLKKAILAASNHPSESATPLYNTLAAWAFSEVIDEHDQSPKARQFRYIRWMAQGKKDETSPFLSPLEQPVGSKIPGILPVSEASTSCATCGKHNATMKCGRCLALAAGHVSFATCYCSRDCQVKDWNAHKASCKEVQQLFRAVTIFSEVFDHFLAVTYQKAFVLTSITEQSGMIVANVETDHEATNAAKEGSPKWSTFPADLAPSPETAKAVLMHNKCRSTLGDARALFELLIRRTCNSIERVTFVPKNIDVPVHIAHADWHEFSSMHTHQVVLAILPSGLQLAIDPAGLEMGWKELISPWAAYANHRVHRVHHSEVVHPQPAGYATVANHFKIPYVASCPEMKGWKGKIVETVAHRLNKQLEIPPIGANVAKFLRLPEPQFTACRTAFVEAAKRGVSTLARDAQDGAKPSCVIPDWAERTKVSKEWQIPIVCGDMDMIWYADSDLSGRGRGRADVATEAMERWVEVMRFGSMPGLDSTV